MLDPDPSELAFIEPPEGVDHLELKSIEWWLSSLGRGHER